MSRSNLSRHVGRCFTNYRELVSHGASDEFRLLERGAVQSAYELRDKIDGLDDIPEVQLLTPHRGAATPASRSRE